MSLPRAWRVCVPSYTHTHTQGVLLRGLISVEAGSVALGSEGRGYQLRVRCRCHSVQRQKEDQREKPSSRASPAAQGGDG